jgi:prepilin-type N-terminal cleavage/methylation domain-containing protein
MENIDIMDYKDFLSTQTSQKFNHRKKGFTIIELIIILVVLSILVAIAVPEVLDARGDTRSLMCGTALNQIEVAKSAWAREFPGAPLTSTNQLLRYLPDGFPKDPWGVGFENVLDLNEVTTHPYNGISAFEPEGSSDATWLENGHNDIGNPNVKQ